MDISLGEKDGEPKFVISDLLIHLAGKQQERPLKEGLRGEEAQYHSRQHTLHGGRGS